MSADRRAKQLKGVKKQLKMLRQKVAALADQAGRVGTGKVANTGAHPLCASHFGNFGHSSSAGGPSQFPGAPFRGGDFAEGVTAGPLAVDARHVPLNSSALIGFRGAR